MSHSSHESHNSHCGQLQLIAKGENPIGHPAMADFSVFLA
jgi:hypothetical protein